MEGPGRSSVFGYLKGGCVGGLLGPFRPAKGEHHRVKYLGMKPQSDLFFPKFLLASWIHDRRTNNIGAPCFGALGLCLSKDS